MAENPFADAGTERRNYLLLVSASKETASAVMGVLQRLKDNVDRSADTLWVDSKGLGVFFSTDMVGYDIWNAILETGRVDLATIKDILIVEVGKDWMARKESKADHWLTTHVGRPLSPPIRGRR